MRGRGKSARNTHLIEVAHDILVEIQPATVRAICYQLFTRKLITSMVKGETNRVSIQLRDAREAEIIPWEWIVDETREPERVSAWTDLAEYVGTLKRDYRKDRWVDQPRWIEVWSEKGTVRGTLAPVLNQYGVTFRVMHGYGSATAVHQAAEESRPNERMLEVLYVGDWDPSGLHMSEADLPARITRYHGTIILNRLAINATDTTDDLPWFSAETKRGDSRHEWVTARYGDRCWELDAMSPAVLRARVEDAIVTRIDSAAWLRAGQAEQAELDSLMDILSKWPGKSRQASKCSDQGQP